MVATLKDYGLEFMRVPLFYDSTSAICIDKNPVLQAKTKHKEVRFHFLRDHYEKGDIDLIHVDTDNQLADIVGIFSVTTKNRDRIYPRQLRQKCLLVFLNTITKNGGSGPPMVTVL
jgi:hypothetical protein